jgi:hypothetical protein
MKNIIIILSFILIRCVSVEKSIILKVKNEIAQNDETAVLLNEKLIIPHQFSAFKNHDKINKDFFPEIYNRFNYSTLKEQYKNDTVKTCWKEKEKNKFGFKKMIVNSDRNFYKRNEICFSISDPIFTKDKKTMLFFIKNDMGLRNPTKYVYIYKKEKSKWVYMRSFSDEF